MVVHDGDDGSGSVGEMCPGTGKIHACIMMGGAWLYEAIIFQA